MRRLGSRQCRIWTDSEVVGQEGGIRRAFQGSREQKMGFNPAAMPNPNFTSQTARSSKASPD